MSDVADMIITNICLITFIRRSFTIFVEVNRMDYKDYQPFINSLKNRKVQVLATDFTNGARVEFVADCEEKVEGAKLIGETMHSFE